MATPEFQAQPEKVQYVSLPGWRELRIIYNGPGDSDPIEGLESGVGLPMELPLSFFRMHREGFRLPEKDIVALAMREAVTNARSSGKQVPSFFVTRWHRPMHQTYTDCGFLGSKKTSRYINTGMLQRVFKKKFKAFIANTRMSLSVIKTTSFESPNSWLRSGTVAQQRFPQSVRTIVAAPPRS
jgi:hypothetical protein